MTRSRDRESGAALVELALLAPLFVLLLLGIVEFGRMAYTQINLEEAAQEGVQYASFNPTDPMGARQRVIQSVDDPALVLADVSLVCTSPTQVEVRVTRTVAMITGAFGISDMTLDATAAGDVLSLTTTCSSSP